MIFLTFKLLCFGIMMLFVFLLTTNTYHPTPISQIFECIVQSILARKK